MKKLLLYIGLIIVASWIVGFLFKGCAKPGPDHSGDKKQIDSLTAVIKVHDATHQKEIDSVVKDNVTLHNEKDSLIAIHKADELSLISQGEDIAGLIDQINKAESTKDTAGIISGCDSLKNQFLSAKGLVVKYVRVNDSLLVVNDKIIANKDEIIGRLNKMYTETNQGLFETSLKYNNLYADYKKVNVKQKRFGIGPVVAVGISGGKIAVIPGIGVQYSLIKF
jgi:hypothetical protein